MADEVPPWPAALARIPRELKIIEPRHRFTETQMESGPPIRRRQPGPSYTVLAGEVALDDNLLRSLRATSGQWFALDWNGRSLVVMLSPPSVSEQNLTVTRQQMTDGKTTKTYRIELLIKQESLGAL